MSNMDHFDKYIKDALGNYSPALPEGAWEKIAAERERRKPKAAWYFTRRSIIGLAALLLCSTAVLMFTEKKFSNDTPIAQNSSSVTDNNSIAGDNKIAADDLNKESTTGTDKINSTNSKETIHNSKTELNKVTVTAKENSNRKESEILQAEKNTITTNKSYKRFTVLKDKNYKTGKSYNIKQSSADTDNAGEEEIDNDTYSSSGYTLLNKLAFNTEKITAFSLKDFFSLKPSLQGITPTPCPQIEMDAAGNKSYWEFYAGPDYASRKFRDTTNSAYLQKRKASTTFSSAYSAGVRYTRVFNNGVSVRAGINYSQVNEKFSFLQSNIVQVNYIIDPISGDTTGSYTTRGTRYKTTYNHYRTLDVPLLIGYEMGNGKFHANINAGAMVNLYSWQQGETLDTAYQPVSITTGKGDKLYQYKTNIGVGFTAAASLYYKLNDRLHILAEPYVRYNLSPMSRDNLSLQEKFTTIGLRLGLRIDIQ